MKIKKLNKEKGFTLIELMVVVGILGILPGILLPALNMARESGRRAQCANNLKEIGLGLIMYSNENNEMFPTGGASAMEDLNSLYPAYVSERKVFKCPSDSLFVTPAANAGITAGTAFDKDECSYGYDNVHSPGDDPGVAIAGDRPSNTAANVADTTLNSPNHGGTVNAVGTADVAGNGQNMLYIDGHVEWVASLEGGYADAGGNRDNVYTDNAAITGGTDTYILQDGGAGGEVLSEEDIALINLINQDPPLSSSDLRDALIAASPLSDDVLSEMMNRDPLMDTQDHRDVFLSSNPLSDNILSEMINTTNLVLHEPGYRAVLLDNTPLSENILNQAINKDSLMHSAGYKTVLIANSPLPASLLDQVVAGTPEMNANHYNEVLAANGM